MVVFIGVHLNHGEFAYLAPVLCLVTLDNGVLEVGVQVRHERHLVGLQLLIIILINFADVKCQVSLDLVVADIRLEIGLILLHIAIRSWMLQLDSLLL